MELLETKSSPFEKNARIYNAAFSFCSFKSSTGPINLNTGGCVYTMRIMGIVYHTIGPLIPNSGTTPQCAQIYIHDGEDESIEKTAFRNKYSTALDPTIIKILNWTLTFECSNIFIAKFKIANQMLKSNPIADLHIRIETNRDIDKRIYNRPTCSEIAVLIPNANDEDNMKSREAITFKKNGNLESINVNKASYDPLMYPLMFPYGQLGWEYNFYKLNIPKKVKKKFSEEICATTENNDADEDLAVLNNQADIDPEEDDQQLTNKMKYVSCRQFYAYQLCDRPTSYLHKYGRLFMQYIVDAYSKMEDGRVQFLRRNQDKLRCDKYKNIKLANPQKLGKDLYYLYYLLNFFIN